MQRRIYYLYALLLIVIAAGLVLLLSKPTDDTTYTTEVRVTSGTVDVQSPEGTARLEAGEKSVVSSSGKVTKTQNKTSQEAEADTTDTATFTMSGRIEDDAGSMVSDAAIKVYKTTQPDSPIRKTISSSSGTFELTDLKPNQLYTLLAEHTDYFPEKIENIDTATSEIVITFKTGAAIHGKVIDYDKNPIETASVELRSGYNTKTKALRTLKTDADGEFIIDNVPPGKSYYFRATAEGYFPSSVVPHSINPGSASSRTLTLMLRSASTISGIVVDRENNPVGGASFFIIEDVFSDGTNEKAYAESEDNPSVSRKMNTYRNKMFGIYESNDKSDSRGRFHLTLSGKGDYEITAKHPDYGPSDPFIAFIEGGEHYDDVTLVLSDEMLSISGHVEDEHSNPITDADVEIFQEEDDFSMPIWRIRNEKIKTSEDGKFSYRPILHARYYLNVRKEGYLPYESESFEVDETNPSHEEEIVLKGADIISGIIYLTPGVPLSLTDKEIRRFVIVIEKSGSRFNYDYYGVNKLKFDETGRFTLDSVEDGEYELHFQISHAKNFYLRDIENVSAGTTDVELVLIEGYSTVTGRIVEEGTMSPLESILMIMSPRQKGPGPTRVYGAVLGSIHRRPDLENGRFEISDIPPGHYEISFFSNEYVKKDLNDKFELQPGEKTDLGTLLFTRGLTFRGKLVSGYDGTAIQGANISSRLFGGATSSEDGYFEVAELPVATVKFKITHPEYAELEISLDLNQVSASQEHTIELYQGATVEGTVTYPDGSPVPNYKISATQHEYFVGSMVPKHTRTNEEGYYRLDNLTPGKIFIFTDKTDTETEMHDKQTTTINIILPEDTK